MTGFLLGVLTGYIVCVLFPLPFINRWIIDFWARLLANKPPSTDY